ncbi:hypothetical protein Htur_1273 [Haloterrigena turkmenica DSM 5511]|uniref:Uncharacterized protein n=1 Tax=Haloterrigena turkmenica (strain ATCC 51198 / DSM 5511 / JCM 9101 / NCIMB 13204 / VKM B-1734 / 4k) TaxID=543526 RepID=D2RPC9_HALTV|nr:hypothetical protein Htur_1273 [Haloterrigena turkmenica DSM 5511]
MFTVTCQSCHEVASFETYDDATAWCQSHPAPRHRLRMVYLAADW